MSPVSSWPFFLPENPLMGWLKVGTFLVQSAPKDFQWLMLNRSPHLLGGDVTGEKHHLCPGRRLGCFPELLGPLPGQPK